VGAPGGIVGAEVIFVGMGVGGLVGFLVGGNSTILLMVGLGVGLCVVSGGRGDKVGLGVGTLVGALVGAGVGSLVVPGGRGDNVGLRVGLRVGLLVGLLVVGERVGEKVAETST